MTSRLLKAGDLARVVRAWNKLAIGEIAYIRGKHADGRLRIVLLGNPLLALAHRDNGAYCVTRRYVASQDALEPLDADEAASVLRAMSTIERARNLSVPDKKCPVAEVSHA
ncbi:hypothetical protein [Burkholderia gladioli]|uniref:hypothetical protein n=1 Tax=Burkholderia gladioli TaxID=28095 RepID=UPI003B980FBF